MKSKPSSKKSKLKIILWGGIAFIAFLIIFSFIYLRLHTYHPDQVALENLKSSDEIKVTENSSLITFDNLKKETPQAFIIYPGGLVEPQAYSQLCRLISESFDLCFIPTMPLNFAIFNPNKAEEIIQAHPEIKQWSLVGHSLGGPAAARFIKYDPDAIQNLILLGSYSDVDISQIPVDVFSLLGSNDGEVNQETYKNSQPNLPADADFQIIEGGNHSQMGDYGFQKGDKQATISSQRQKEIILEAIKKLIPSVS